MRELRATQVVRKAVRATIMNSMQTDEQFAATLSDGNRLKVISILPAG